MPYIEMHVLPYIFTILKFSGIWRPIEWSSGWRRNVYWLYTSLVIVAMYTFSISEAVYTFQCIDDLEEMTNSSFMLLTMACVICKAVNILNSRRDIIRFTNILKNDNCRPNGSDEVKMQEKFDRQIKQTALWYVTMIGMSAGTLSTGSLLIDVPRQTLHFNAWVPFNFTTPMRFWSAYLHQILAHGFGAAVCAAYDALFCGLINQTCAQLKILKFRLQFMPQTIDDQTDDEKTLNYGDIAQEAENRVLARCIIQHRDIFEFADSVNEAFGIVIFLQCASSTLGLCISVYALSRLKFFTIEFICIVLYVVCMLTQIFIYCWFGNELIIESMDVANAVYAMDWTKLSVRTQKNLQVVMIRSLEPIRFTSGNIIILSLDTFISLLKLSYSTFNLLQQTSKQ